MGLLRWMGVTFARFVGLVVMILGAWIAGRNGWEALAGTGGYRGWVLALILFTGIAGAVGGFFYLLSFDGPSRFRTRRARLYGWAGMMISALLPTTLTVMLVPLVGIVFPGFSYLRIEEPPTSG